MAVAQEQLDEKLRSATQHLPMLNNTVANLLTNATNENYIVMFIRRGLVDPARHEATLRLLCSIVPHFSKEVLQDHLVIFSETVLTNKIECEAKFEFLNIAIPYINSHEDINKSKVLLLIPKVVEKCASIDKYSPYEAQSLSCLASCLELYPSTCGPYKQKLEDHLLGYLSYDKQNFVIEKAAKCFHYLQQCGPAGLNSINHSENWKNALNKICLTIKELFRCVKDASYTFHSSGEGSLLLPLAVDNYTNDRLLIAEHRLRSLLAYTTALIEFKYSAPKLMKPHLMIDLLEFCTNHEHPANQNSGEGYHSSSIQTIVEIELFYIFRSYIAVLKLNLMPFSNKIMKILTDRLHESRGNLHQYNGEYKEGLYRLISYFVQIMRSNVSSQFHKKLMDAILDDIKPITQNVTIKVSTGNSGKDRQKMIENQTAVSGHRKGNREPPGLMASRETVCCSALACLEECFRSLNLNIDYNSLKNIYKMLCTTLISIQNGITTPPYLTSASISKLYEVLIAALEQIHPPPLQIVHNILLVGQAMGGQEVSKICTFGLMVMEKICQPIRPLVFSTMSSDRFVTDSRTKKVTTDEKFDGLSESTFELSLHNQDPKQDEIHQDNQYQEMDTSDADALTETQTTTSSKSSEEESEDLVEPTLTLGENSKSPPKDIWKNVDENEVRVEDMLESFKDVPAGRSRKYL